MILEVHHETRLSYSVPVAESVTEVRMEAASDQNQSVRSFQLSISPTTEIFRYLDGFGNHVHHFNVRSSCQEIRIVAAGIIETHPQEFPAAGSSATWPIAEERMALPARSFLSLTGPVRYTPRLEPLLDQLRPEPGMPLVDVAMRIAGHICENFTYAKDVTLASSPIDDVLREGKGVCQDFTHLMIAIARSFGLPARYVSGYIHRPNNESQSHAWCEVWLPELGWYGIDPTNNRHPNDHFVKVAIGRDFTDVPPNKGIYRGKAVEEIFVRVETRALDRLPSLSWQDTAPTFEVPFTAIVARHFAKEGEYGGDAQQQ